MEHQCTMGHALGCNMQFPSTSIHTASRMLHCFYFGSINTMLAEAHSTPYSSQVTVFGKFGVFWVPIRNLFLMFIYSYFSQSQTLIMFSILCFLFFVIRLFSSYDFLFLKVVLTLNLLLSSHFFLTNPLCWGTTTVGLSVFPEQIMEFYTLL